MKVCPQCKSLMTFNTYFGALICCECNYMDDSFNKERAYIGTISNISLKEKNEKK